MECVVTPRRLGSVGLPLFLIETLLEEDLNSTLYLGVLVSFLESDMGGDFVCGSFT